MMCFTHTQGIQSLNEDIRNGIESKVRTKDPWFIIVQLFFVERGMCLDTVDKEDRILYEILYTLYDICDLIATMLLKKHCCYNGKFGSKCYMNLRHLSFAKKCRGPLHLSFAKHCSTQLSFAKHMHGPSQLSFTKHACMRPAASFFCETLRHAASFVCETMSWSYTSFFCETMCHAGSFVCETVSCSYTGFDF